MENKGNKSGNIYQKLKGAGAWQSKDSAGPMIKGVGIKSPLNMKKASPVKDIDSDGNDRPLTAKQQAAKDAKNKEFSLNAPKGKTKSKKDPYAKAAKVDPKLGEYVKQRKGLKKGSPEYAKIQNKINKAYGVKKRYDEGKKVDKVEKVDKVDKNDNEGDGTKPATTTTTTTTATTEASKNPAKDARKQAKLDNKAKRKANKTARQQKRADRIKKEGGTKVGNFLRKGVKKVKEVVKKKTDGEKISSAAQMKKSAMKMGKKSPIKLSKIADKIAAGKKKKDAKVKAKKSTQKPSAGPKDPLYKAPLKMKKSAMKMNEGFDKLPADVQAKIKKNK
tara:strand:- start:5493 stop:6491 length:999 start_codon:yes stop_codon:yes gene_type:complete